MASAPDDRSPRVELDQPPAELVPLADQLLRQHLPSTPSSSRSRSIANNELSQEELAQEERPQQGYSHDEPSQHELPQHETGKSTDPLPKVDKAGSTSSGLFRFWLPELISSLVSIAALLALIVCLRVYDKRGLTDLRLPSYLTINGLVALIATINRTALLGPVEATICQERWLWFSQRRKGSMPRGRLIDLEVSDAASRSAWGSLVFLVRGRGHFVSYLGALVVIVSLAFGTFTQQLIAIDSFPVTGNNTGGQIVGATPRQLTWDAYAPGGDVPINMKAAVYSGIMAPANQIPQTTCSTGNCTWPITPSLAVCGECHEVEYTKKCNPTDCVFTTEFGTRVDLTNLNTPGGAGTCWQTVTTKPTPAQDDRYLITSFISLGVPYESFSQSGFYGLTSSRCSLYWCVNAYLRVSIAGNQRESIVATRSLVVDRHNNVLSPTLPRSFNPAPDEEYSVGTDSSQTLSGKLKELVTGTGYCGIDDGANEVRSSDTIDAIWNATTDGLDVWIKNLAQTMTNVIRTQSASSSDGTYYVGTAHQLSIQVRWVWITLPIVMVATSLVILIFEMYSTATSNVRPWKASPLALLFTDVEATIKEKVGWDEMTQTSGLEKEVGKQRAVLVWGPAGRLEINDAVDHDKA